MLKIEDHANDRIELRGDGYGWGTYDYEYPTFTPGDVDAALYIDRFWFTGLPSQAEHSARDIPWKPALYWCFSFDGVHPEYTATTSGSDYDKILGPVARRHGSYYSDDIFLVNHDAIADKQDYAYPSRIDLAYYYYAYYDGLGNMIAFAENHDSTTETKPDNVMPGTAPATEAKGLASTYLTYVTKEEGNDRVRVESWLNTDSIDLAALDLVNVSVADPKATFPVSNGWTTGSQIVNGASDSGNNWIDASGNLQLPSHRIYRNPFPDLSLFIDQCMVKTAKLVG